MEEQLPPGWKGLNERMFQSLYLIGRLKPGVGVEQASAEANLLFKQLLLEYSGPQPSAERLPDIQQARIELTPAGRGLSELRKEFSLPLKILMIVVGVVLLIACANIANLLMARATARQQEFTVRVALGASPARIARQLLTESLPLALLGGAAGILLGSWGSSALVSMVSTGAQALPLNVEPDLRVLAFTLIVSVISAVVFGTAPAIRASRVELSASLRSNRASSSGMTRSLLGKALLVSQVALSLLLLVGAGLFVRSLQKLWAIDPGYDRKNVLMFSLDPRLAGYKENAKLISLYGRLLSDLRTLPGVRSASLSLVRPVDDAAYWVNGVESIDGRKLPEDQGIRVAVNRLGPGYFATLGTSMLLGREFGPEDNEKTPRVAIVSEILARRCFGNGNPIGRRIADHDDGEVQIVGVVRDSRYGGVRDVPRSVLYMPFFQANLAEAFFDTTFELRHSGSVSTVLDEVRRRVRAIDPNLPLFRVKTLEVQTEDSFVKERLIATLSTFFGLLAALLACVGLYGTLAYGVARRTGEIGVRMALGATRRDVLWMVLRETLVLIAIGVVVGLPCSVGASRLLASQLYGVKPTDALTLAAGALLFAGVAVFAGYDPARRASRVDPMVALRYE